MAVLATLSLAAALACGGTVVGCGSSSSNNNNTSGDSGTTGDTGTTHTDGGADTGTQADTGSPVDTGTGVDTGVPEAATQLASPTFTPPGPATAQGQEVVTINPPAGFPANGLLFYSLTGTPPSCTGAGIACTGTGYVGPITIQTVGVTTVWALAAAPGDLPSNPVSATYTITAPEAGGINNPVISPSTGQYNNDFLASIQADPGVTVCYRLDGNPPTCAAGVCTGGSQTYNGATEVNITGAVTSDPTTGKVTLNAIACDAAGSVSQIESNDYQLVVSQPTMVNPIPGTNIPWPTGQAGLTPTISTTTVSSNENVSIWYYAGAAGTTVQQPTCITGTEVANPTTFNNGAVPNNAPPIGTNTLLIAVGCKYGYLPSAAAPFTYTIQLHTPVMPVAKNPYFLAPAFVAAGEKLKDFDDSANANAANESLCITTDGTAASCTAAGACGGTSSALTTVQVGSLTSANTVLDAISCAPGVDAPAAAAPVTYTLQLSQPFVASSDLLQATLPGWGDAVGGTGLPTTALTLPAGATLPYPIGDTSCTSGIHDTNGNCIWQFAQVEPLPACAATEFGCATQNAVADYYCWGVSLKGATVVPAACGTTANTCATGSAKWAGTVATSSTAMDLTTTGTTTGTALGSVHPGDTLSLIACQNPGARTGTGNWVYNDSLATDIGPVQAAGGATEPQANPPGGAFTSQAVVTVTNNDANASLLCFTTDGTTPTCTVAGGTATCGGTGTTWCGQTTAAGAAPSAPVTGASCASTTASSLIPSKGTFQIPAVGSSSVSNFLQASTAAGGTLNAVACNVTDGVSAVYTPAPYTFSMAQPDFGLAYQTGSNACAAQKGTCFGDNTSNSGGTVGAGSYMYLTDQSNYDFNLGAGAPPPAISIHWAWNATPNCGTTASNCPTGGLSCGASSPLNYGVNAPTAPAAPQVFSFWTTPAGGGTLVSVTQVPLPPSGSTTVTLNAIACGENTNLQANSAVRSAVFTVQAATPFLATNESCTPNTLALCGTTTGCPGSLATAVNSGEQAYLDLGQNNEACPAVSNWERSIGFVVADVTPNSTLCWQAGAQPHCTLGTCSAGSNKVVGGAFGPVTAVQTVDGAANLQTGATIYAAACTGSGAGSLPEVDMVPFQFNLNTTPADLTDGTGTGGLGGKIVATGATLACGIINTTDAAQTSLQADQDSNPGTYQAGGPTPNECYCYTTDGTPVNLASCTGASSCANASTGSTHCAAISTTGATPPGPNAVVNVSIDGPVTVNYATCVFGASYNAFTGSPAFKVTPYEHQIVVDGDTKEWLIGLNGSAHNEEGGNTTAGSGTGLFSYDGTNLYFGFVDASGSTTTPATFAANNYIGILLGDGIAAGAPQTVPPQAGFGTVTIAQGLGAQYFISWQTTSTTTTVYSWTAGSPGSWSPVATGIAVDVAAGVNSISGGSADVEFSIPISQLPLLTNATTNTTLTGIYATGVGTGTPVSQFSWWAGGSTTVGDGWFNDFQNSCVAPSYTDISAPASVVAANPNH